MGSYKDLVLYKKSFALAVEIFVITKQFPKEEVYSLTNQIRAHRGQQIFVPLKLTVKEFIQTILSAN